MFLRRSAAALARQARLSTPIATRSFAVSATKRTSDLSSTSFKLTSRIGSGGHGHDAPAHKVDRSKLKTLDEIKTDEDLLPPGAPVGTVPTDLNQSTGLERLELLGKMQGIDIFDMAQPVLTKKGTLEDPIIEKSWGEEYYVGCTGFPQDSHTALWLTLSRDRPQERCTHCGQVFKMEYIGPEDPHHGHPPHVYEPQTFADIMPKEYYYK
jgi:cytochrome c oxidase subunit 5b